MNTYQVKHLISKLTFNDALTKISNYVFVNLDWLTNRDYQSQGVNELIFTLGQYKSSIFVFLIRDGVNCNLSGLDNLIKVIIKNFNLTQDSCFVYSYENLEIENSTFIELDAVQMWCNNVAQNINLPLSRPFCNKKFAGLFGRHDLYRLKIFRHLFDNYKQDSVLSYNATRAHWNHRFDKDFIEDQSWFNNHCPVLLDFEQASGWIPFQKSLEVIGNHYNDYFLEIVCETNPYSNRFFTEKSLKNFYLGKPFILFAGPGSLQYLRARGFQTFEPYINETYDTIDCPYERYNAIVNEIDRLAQFSFFDLQTILHKLIPIFEHNRQRFQELAAGKNL